MDNPVIIITQPELAEQAASLGAPVTMALSSSNFAEIAPVGLQIPDSNGGAGGIPGVDDNNGATTVFIMFTSVITVLVMASASIFIA